MLFFAKTKSKPLDNWFSSDDQFHQLYPEFIQQLADKHWTPLKIVKKAAQFLAEEEGVKILDIGSGVGKFCLSAARYHPGALFYGIEQRKNLVDYADAAKKILGLLNVSFIHGNFTQLNLKQYNHFYFYNPFFENLDGTEKIDGSLLYSESLYNYYNQYMYVQLEEMPLGTRVVTCCSWDEEIPPGYQLVATHFEKLLKFWVKR